MLMIATPTLNRTEWQAVSIALRDAERRPARRGGALARVGRMITGTAPTRPLADSRLEAIRDFVCETRRRGVAPEPLAGALAREGFSPVQIAALALLAR